MLDGIMYSMFFGSDCVVLFERCLKWEWNVRE